MKKERNRKDEIQRNELEEILIKGEKIYEERI